MYTFVALQGPSLTTVRVNMSTLVTLTSVPMSSIFSRVVKLKRSTVLLILKSTIGFAVILGIVSLLFDLFVSFSVLVTLTVLVMFPTAVTLA